MLGLAWVGLVLALSCVNGQQRELVFRLGSVMETANDVPECPGRLCPPSISIYFQYEFRCGCPLGPPWAPN
eukprot:1158117-Pelagomonas_calceolata.AAC.4